MPGSVPGHVHHGEFKAQFNHLVVVLQAVQGLGDVFTRRPPDPGASGFAKGVNATNMVGMVMRD